MKRLAIIFLPLIFASAAIGQTSIGPKGDKGCSVLQFKPSASIPEPPASLGMDCDTAIELKSGKWWGPKLNGAWGIARTMSPVDAAQAIADSSRVYRDAAQQARDAAQAAQTGAAAQAAAAQATAAAASASAAAANGSRADAAVAAAAALAAKQAFDGSFEGGVLSKNKGGAGDVFGWLRADGAGHVSAAPMGSGVETALGNAPGAAGGFPLFGSDGSLGAASGDIYTAAMGVKGDNSTDNASVLNALISASTPGRCLVFTDADGGQIRTSSLTALGSTNVCMRFEGGAQLLNMDGTLYNGAFFANGWNVSPSPFEDVISVGGARITRPGFDALWTGQSGVNRSNTFLQYNGVTAFPYGVNNSWRDFVMVGNGAPTVGSVANVYLANLYYNVSNGPGITFSCTATNGSNVLTACSPAPNGQSTINGVTVNNVYAPAKIVLSGMPTNSYATAWSASTITVSGPNGASGNYSGATGPVAVQVISGRSENNNISLILGAVGQSGAGGPAGGMNWYNDIIVGSNISSDANDQEGYLSALDLMVTKLVPGNVHDWLHNGSNGANVTFLPYSNNGSHATSYKVNDGLALQGHSGPWSCAYGGGQCAGATPAATNALRVGGEIENVYAQPGLRSLFEYGVVIEDYIYGAINIRHPAHASNSAWQIPDYSIQVCSGCGVGIFSDGLRLGGSNGILSVSDSTNLFIAGGATGGGGLNLYGPAHATKPNKIEISAGGVPTAISIDGNGLLEAGYLATNGGAQAPNAAGVVAGLYMSGGTAHLYSAQTAATWNPLRLDASDLAFYTGGAKAGVFSTAGLFGLTQAAAWVAPSNCGSLSGATKCAAIIDPNGNTLYLPAWGTY